MANELKGQTKYSQHLHKNYSNITDQNCPAQSSSLLFWFIRTEAIHSKAQVSNSCLCCCGNEPAAWVSNCNPSQINRQIMNAMISVRNKNSLSIMPFPPNSLSERSPLRWACNSRRVLPGYSRSFWSLPATHLWFPSGRYAAGSYLWSFHHLITGGTVHQPPRGHRQRNTAHNPRSLLAFSGWAKYKTAFP